MVLKELECKSCGASIEWHGTYGKTITCSYCGSTFISAATEMEDVWLMTDPVARARYEFSGELNKLEHDIRYEVLRGQDWSELDHAYLEQITRLEQDGVVRKIASFWVASPHPTVYRALQDGEINLGKECIPFHKDDEIIWACPMTQDKFTLNIPVLIGDFQDAKIQRLCGEIVNTMQGRMI